ncbi:hypothetical protein D3C83_49760 [compost metagenome]
MRGRPELPFDFHDEALDALRRRQRLLTLKANEPALGLVVREVELHQTAADQESTHQRDEDDDVLPEKLPAG